MMHDTLSSLVERALTDNQRPLEFYLRDNSRLPGPRANLELANDVSALLAASISKYPVKVRSLLNYFTNGDRKMVVANTPDEFLMLCGIIAFGDCAAIEPCWRQEVFDLLDHYACSSHWRIREAAAIAFQHLLMADTGEMIAHLIRLASGGSYLQQRAAIAALAEPPLLYGHDILKAALQVQQIVLERLRDAPEADRKSEDFRVLRRTLGYTLSVVTAAQPEQGFALMRECACWNNADITWVLRENLKKKRLARFVEHTEVVARLLT
ncbi:MAG: hypothetical protein JO125_00215 [Chloroflexi bacterium]|nr:hypothetical protein [Ktedonobacteraceae bacterium]MBV9020990.1 hypothetical protein [Ktedonobacteraceae bacterium]MBV9705815.1 hypothetical protein [Chloroflexota bacterium]